MRPSVVANGTLLGKALSETFRKIVDRLNPSADLSALVTKGIQILDASAALGVPIDLWDLQNRLLDAYVRLSEAGALDRPLIDVFSELASRLKISQDVLGWKP